MITREQAEDLAMELAIKSIGWPPELTERKQYVLKEILAERDSILKILDKELHQIQE